MIPACAGLEGAECVCARPFCWPKSVDCTGSQNCKRLQPSGVTPTHIFECWIWEWERNPTFFFLQRWNELIYPSAAHRVWILCSQLNSCLWHFFFVCNQPEPLQSLSICGSIDTGTICILPALKCLWDWAIWCLVLDSVNKSNWKLDSLPILKMVLGEIRATKV